MTDSTTTDVAPDDVVASHLTGLPVGVEVLGNGDLRVTVYAEDLVEAVDEDGATADTRLRAAEFLARGTALVATHLPAPLTPLEAFAEAELAHGHARIRLDDAARAARAAGHSWADLGRALGVSRQAAWERFRHVDEEVSPS